MIETTVCIIGAGPGGAATALQLHQYGIKCVIVDKAIFPRDKVCGDGLTGKVFSALNNIDKGIGERLLQYAPKLDSFGIEFIAPNRSFIDFKYKLKIDRNDKPFATSFVCKRIDFDNFLVEEMKRCDNIQFIQGQSIDKYTLKDDGYILSNSKSDFKIKAQLVIVANGAYSGFTKEVANIHMEPNHYCAGVRAYYKNISGISKDGIIELHFLKSLMPGYFWIFPLPNGEANVGLGNLSEVVRKKKLNLKKLLLETVDNDPVLKERFKDAVLLGNIDGYGLPLGSKKRVISGERYMLVGDAGYLIDPFTGEGIGNALYTGRMAAERAVAAISANDFSAKFLTSYDEAVYAKLGSELKISTRLQKFANKPLFFNFILSVGLRNKQLRELMTCMFYEIDVRKKLTNPMFYIKLLLNRA